MKDARSTLPRLALSPDEAAAALAGRACRGDRLRPHRPGRSGPPDSVGRDRRRRAGAPSGGGSRRPRGPRAHLPRERGRRRRRPPRSPSRPRATNDPPPDRAEAGGVVGAATADDIDEETAHGFRSVGGSRSGRGREPRVCVQLPRSRVSGGRARLKRRGRASISLRSSRRRHGVGDPIAWGLDNDDVARSD